MRPDRAEVARENDFPVGLMAKLRSAAEKGLPGEVAALSGFYETAVEFKGILVFLYS
jgi:hypothetical protein